VRDSVTGQVLARAVDRAQGASLGGHHQVSNGVASSADARRAIAKRADVLRVALDQISGKSATR